MTLTSGVENGGFYAPTRLMLLRHEDFEQLHGYNPRLQFRTLYFLIQNKKELQGYEFVVAYLPEKSTNGAENSSWKLKEKVTVQFPFQANQYIHPAFEHWETEAPVKQLIPFPGAPCINGLVEVQGYRNRTLKSRKRRTDKKSSSLASAPQDECALAQGQPADTSLGDRVAVEGTYQPKQLLFVHALIARFYERGGFSRWDYVLRSGKSKISEIPFTYAWAKAAASRILFTEGEVLSEIDLQLRFDIADSLWVIHNEKLHAAIVLGTNFDKTTRLLMIQSDGSSSPPSPHEGEAAEGTAMTTEDPTGKNAFVRNIDLTMSVVREQLFVVSTYQMKRSMFT